MEERLRTESDKHQQELSALEEVHRLRATDLLQAQSAKVEELQALLGMDLKHMYLSFLYFQRLDAVGYGVMGVLLGAQPH